MQLKPLNLLSPMRCWAATVALILGQTLSGSAQSPQTLVGWGANDSLQTQIPAGLTNVIALAAGESHSLALRSDGTVAAWGFNVSGQATVPTNLANVIAIAGGGSYSMALKQDGTVVVWGDQAPPPSGLSNVTAIAAGWSHSLALKSDGTVVSWGTQSTVPAFPTNVVAISAGRDYSLALLGNGTVVAWGDDTYGETNVPPGLTNVTQIAAGGGHALALANGKVVAWGRNDYGQSTVPAAATNVVILGGGALHSLVLKGDGTLVAWGNDVYGQVSSTPAGAGFFGIAAGGYHNLALRGNGSPTIYSQPASQSIPLGGTATFRVGAIGLAPLAYQWFYEQTNLVPSTTSTFVLRNVQFTNAGAYSVVITNSAGSITSAPAILTPLGIPPYVTSPPLNSNAVCGENASFQVKVGGSGPFAYQWQFAGTNIAGATGTRLALTNVDLTDAGLYSVTVTNDYGSVTTGAVLSITVEAPLITSSLSLTGLQGAPFTYTIHALHSPNAFGAFYLPNGLAVNPTNGVISGIPQESGTFGPILTAANACTNDVESLQLTINSGAPVITGSNFVTGAAGSALSVQIQATGLPAAYGGESLPPGVYVNPVNGNIYGTPLYAGSFSSTIWASNLWGAGYAPMSFVITNPPIQNLNIGGVSFAYSSPYVLDFQFSLFTLTDPNDTNTATSVVVDPRLLSVKAFENGEPISDTETAPLLVGANSRLSSKLEKVALVLDFTESIASLANGDTNHNGVSDAVDFMVQGAENFVNQQSSDTQIGVWEFHRDDEAPNNVTTGLVTDHVFLDNAIAGIWTNYVNGFSSGSRAWDAALGAIGTLGPANPDEQHYLILVSDGSDESSTATLQDVITAATNDAVRIFCLGFGVDLNAANLSALAAATQGRFYTATNAADLNTQFGQITKAAAGQYLLRWATLQRSTNAFMPSFEIDYNGVPATSPTNPIDVTVVTNYDTNTPPNIIGTSNIYTTNIIIGPYTPSLFAGPVTVGSLRLVPNSDVEPTGIDLRATYVPRYVRELSLHYRPNWPCTVALDSSGPGELLSGWSLTQTNDGAGGFWLLLSSPNPADTTTSMPFAGFGQLLTFTFQDVINPTNAFSFFTNDNSIYTNIFAGGQSFYFATSNTFIKTFPTLPYGTPVPWLISYGLVTNVSYYTNLAVLSGIEASDSDGDGMANWQEYLANTNPTNAASVFEITDVSRQADGRFQVTFTTSTNRTYRVQASTDLLNWQTIQDNIPGINQDVTITDTRFIPNLTNIFYRAVVY